MAKKAFSLETAFQRLEEILQVLESGTIDLEESIKLYEEGMRLANQCQKQLRTLEERVKIINEGETTRSIEQKAEDEEQ